VDGLQVLAQVVGTAPEQDLRGGLAQGGPELGVRLDDVTRPPPVEHAVDMPRHGARVPRGLG
jgi:hypothetical protein